MKNDFEKSLSLKNLEDTQANMRFAFSWQDSPEGCGFWAEVDNRLTVLIQLAGGINDPYRFITRN